MKDTTLSINMNSFAALLVLVSFVQNKVLIYILIFTVNLHKDWNLQVKRKSNKKFRNLIAQPNRKLQSYTQFHVVKKTS